MAYLPAGLSALANANGFTLWHYSTADPIATVNTAAYFTGDAVNMLQPRDVIMVSDSNVPSINWVIVLTNDGTTVDVSDGTVIVETDSD
jgi:hypothetical protein|tara:strand:- start:7 stop:273 length:267 start_codon:yes stop_codon:yes gene_type:complete